MRYIFHPEAEAEFLHAIDYYEDRENGLGYDFAVEVYSAIERAVSNPKAWPAIVDDIRRSLVNRFPYGVLYSEEDGVMIVIAVMHLHRDPDYWEKRI
jgi:plasmid stabilization system protein ParE